MNTNHIELLRTAEKEVEWCELAVRRANEALRIARERRRVLERSARSVHQMSRRERDKDPSR